VITENYGHAGAGYVAGIMNEEPDAARCMSAVSPHAQRKGGRPSAEQRHTDKQLDGLAMLAAGDYFGSSSYSAKPKRRRKRRVAFYGACSTASRARRRSTR
jgi:hypothetical protein